MNIPEGWKLVPVEPTPKMNNAYMSVESYAVRNDGVKTCVAEYKAMLAAAPTPPEQNVVERLCTTNSVVAHETENMHDKAQEDEPRGWLIRSITELGADWAFWPRRFNKTLEEDEADLPQDLSRWEVEAVYTRKQSTAQS